MLFNSYVYILAFLPIVVIGYYLIGSQGRHRISISWLVAASLFFYGWWNWSYLALILGSGIFNYAIGLMLGRKENSSDRRRYSILIAGLALTVALLGLLQIR